MKLLQNILNTVAYYYYPKNMHESDDSYQITKEYKNFLLLHGSWENHKQEIEPLIDKINNRVNTDIIFNGTSNNTPCFEIELLLDSSLQKKRVVVIYISLFIPFYHLILLERNGLSGEILISYNIPEDLKYIVENTISETLHFTKFPNEFLNCSIPDLEVYTDFNYLNAFFTDGYRIAHI